MADTEKTAQQPVEAEPIPAPAEGTETPETPSEEMLPAEEVKQQDLRPGMTVRVHFKIKEAENKYRIQVFQGMIIAMRGKTPVTKTMTVKKNSFGVQVERIFPLASPLIDKIEVVKQARVRRSKLYFLSGYTKRLKETFVKKA